MPVGYNMPFTTHNTKFTCLHQTQIASVCIRHNTNGELQNRANQLQKARYQQKLIHHTTPKSNWTTITGTGHSIMKHEFDFQCASLSMTLQQKSGCTQEAKDLGNDLAADANRPTQDSSTTALQQEFPELPLPTDYNSPLPFHFTKIIGL